LLEIPDRSAQDLLLELKGIHLSRCPFCHQGTMIVIGELPALSGFGADLNLYHLPFYR
jgi:hypothetical protein